MKRIVAGAVFAATIGLTACTSGYEPPAVPSSELPTPTYSTQSQAEIDAANAQSKQQLQTERAALEERVRQQPTVDDQLGIIVAASCELRSAGDIELRYVDMYEKYWHGSSKWPYLLREALNGVYGCPSPAVVPYSEQ